MTVSTDYLKPTEQRIIDWALYYNEVARSEMRKLKCKGYVDTTIDKGYDVIPGEVPAEVQEVEDAINKLPHGIRMPLVHWYYDGYDKQRIGSMTKMSDDRVKTSINRALHAVCVALDYPK